VAADRAPVPLSEEAADTIFLRHGTHGGICWEQCESPGEERPDRYRRGRKSDFDPAAFHAALEPLGGVLNRTNENEAAAKLSVSVRTAWRWWNQFKNNDL